MKLLITGAEGFIGKNLQLYLAQRPDVEVLCYTHKNDVAQLSALVAQVDWVFHLAGVNRPQDPKEFVVGNVDLTQALCQALCAVAQNTGKKIPVVYTSSIQAQQSNAYGQSKRDAEEILFAAARSHQIAVHVLRLPNVFGKWCRPHYNSVVATFCHNIARALPIEVHDPDAPLSLVYVDDVLAHFGQLLDGADALTQAGGFASVQPQYSTTVGALARQIQAFKDSRVTLMSERVGTGLVRALYATYVSYLPVESFTYALPQHADARGVFVEVLKTPDTGQFSFFTAHPGVTRGGHYHHSKSEKFLVIRGHARFQFRHMHTGQVHTLLTTGDKPEVVETVPGWTHDISNVGESEMLVMLWANEVFERDRPDTFACPV